MQPIEQLNIKKLNELVRQMGSKAEFARVIDKSPAQLSQWLSGYRNISASAKREIEKKFNLPAGWFDANEENEYGLQELIQDATNMVKLELLYSEQESQNEIDKLVMRFIMTKKIAVELLGTDELDHIKIFRPTDDSMANQAPKSAMVLIDTSVQKYAGDGVYIFEFQGKKYFRRLIEIKDNILKVTADNTNYKEGNFEILSEERDQLKITGKAWKCLPLAYVDM